jgi:hypothetical protein
MSNSPAFANISGSTDPFHLDGGRYTVTVVKHKVPPPHSGGTVKLQMSKGGTLSPQTTVAGVKAAPSDDAFVSVGSNTDFVGTGSAIVNLQTGSYRFTVDSGSAQMATITLAN